MSCIFFFLLGFGFLLVFGWHRASGSGSILMVVVVRHVSDMRLLGSGFSRRLWVWVIWFYWVVAFLGNSGVMCMCNMGLHT